MHARVRHEVELALHLALDEAALVAVDAVPLVDGDRERAAALGGEPDEMHVLIRDVLARVEHGDHGARILDGLQALHDAVFLDDFARRARGGECRPCR